MVSAGGDGKGTAVMDCWERMCIITGSTGKAIGSKCIMCKGSKTAEGQQRQHTEQERGVRAKWAWQSTILSRISGGLDTPLVLHKRHQPCPPLEQQKRPAERHAGRAWGMGRGCSCGFDCDTPKLIQKACVVPHRVAHAGTFSLSGSSKGT